MSSIMFAEIVKNAAGISAIIAAFTFLIAIGTLWKGVAEYTKNNRMARFEKYEEMRRRLREDEVLEEVNYLVFSDDPRLRDLDVKKKKRFLGFYEELALMHESKLLRLATAHYTFGYLAVCCLASKNFWANFENEKDIYHWALFFRFARAMKEFDDAIVNDRGRWLPDLRM